MKPLKAQIQNHYFGQGNKKGLLIISDRPSPEILLWSPQLKIKPFILYVAEKQGTTLGVLVQS